MQTLTRTFDASALNAVANNGAVRGWLGGQGALDLSDLVANPDNIALSCELGGFVLQKHEPGVYEAHSLFLPSMRGAKAVAAMREGFRYVFTETDAIEVVTKVPGGNASALGLARLAHFEHRFHRDNAWVTESGPVGVDYYALHVSKWAQNDDGCRKAGETFHAQLETAKSRCGSPLAVHEDDPAHDHAAGASMLMALAGQGRKAVYFYNNWARLAGYQTIELVSEQPVIIDVRDAIVGRGANGVEVLSCR